MSRLLLTGINSKIIRCLLEILPAGVTTVMLDREACDMSRVENVDCHVLTIANADFLVIAHGDISGKPFTLLTDGELSSSMNVNLLSVVRMCELALNNNHRARIVVIGSESATKGSYDITYWLAKAALHSYVRERRLAHAGQQLVCVAPSMVTATRMTARKTDKQISEAAHATPKGRGLDPAEVAECIRWLLFDHTGYISNTVVEMNGGKFARRP